MMIVKIARRAKPLAALVGSAAIALLPACSSSSSKSPSVSGTAANNTTTSALNGIGAAKKIVDQFAQPRNAPDVPPGAGHGSALQGKAIHFIASNYAVPVFHTEEAALQKALSTFGVTVTACDGKGNPSTITQCMTTAADQGAVAVVTSSIDPSLVPNAVQMLASKGIVLVTNGVTDDAPKATKDLAPIVGDQSSNGQQQGRVVADWIASDSGGKADALLIDITVTKAFHAVIENTRAEITSACKDCKVTVKGITTTDQTVVANLIRAAFLQDPDINYIAATDGLYVGINQGLQTSKPTGPVKFGFFTASLNGLQMIQKGTVAGVDLGTNTNYQGWADADQLIRMVGGGTPADNYPLPIRLFTKDNLQGLDISQQNVASNTWYGEPFESKFLAAWGAK